MNNKWQYQKVLEDNKVENKFDNFLQFLTDKCLKKRGARSVYSCSSPEMKIAINESGILYGKRGWGNYPTVGLYSPMLLDSLGETYSEIIMMALIAVMLANKDPEFEALIAKKTGEYLKLFEASK